MLDGLLQRTPRLFRKRHPPVGARPGTLMVSEDAAPPVIRVISFDADECAVREEVAPRELPALLGGDRTVWIDVHGLGDEAVLRAIGEVFGLHPLVLEDVVNAPQRPKVEDYGDQVLFVSRMVTRSQAHGLEVEQVALILGPGWVLTFQERSGDVFDPVRRRLHEGLGRIRTAGAGYLAYALIDTIVDAYYPVFDALGDELDELEIEVMERPTPQVLRRLGRIKRTLLQVRRFIWPQRDAINGVLRDPRPLIDEQTRLYFRDTYDHCVQLADVVDNYRELVNGLMNTYLSVLSNRTNEVMKVLTIMASIFIPLTFIAGVYGMNFEFMPELHVWWVYPLLLASMLLIALGMLGYFYRKGWVGNRGTPPRDDAP